MPWLNSWGTGGYKISDDLALAPKLGKGILGKKFADPESVEEEVIKYEAKTR
jgi:hypothetical protein